MIGITIDYVRKLEWQGVLTPIRFDGTEQTAALKPYDRGGFAPRVFYAKEQVDAFAATYVRKIPRSLCRGKGKKKLRDLLCAKVFALFKEGKTLPDIVIETGAGPEVVREYWRQYTTDFVTGDRLIAEERAKKEDDKRARELAAQQYRTMKLMKRRTG